MDEFGFEPVDIDRPDGRRVLATTSGNEHLEFDVEPERTLEAGQTGFVQLRRAKVFADQA